MYYDEAIIDGVLSYRTVPGGFFTPFTAEQLTAVIGSLKNYRVDAQPTPKDMEYGRA